MNAENTNDPTDAAAMQRLRENLKKNGMPPDLINRAVDSWFHLVGSTDQMLSLFETNLQVGQWAQYCFFQGFVAGHMAAVHHN